jgi:hypothetical protein
MSVIKDVTYQARCERCGWHSYPVAFAKQAERWDEAHMPKCPNPVRRVPQQPGEDT